jgi:hypothetical protein
MAEKITAEESKAREEFLIDTFASWALEDMHPTKQALENARAYIKGEKTLDEIIAQVKAEAKNGR